MGMWSCRNFAKVVRGGHRSSSRAPVRIESQGHEFRESFGTDEERHLGMAFFVISRTTNNSRRHLLSPAPEYRKELRLIDEVKLGELDLVERKFDGFFFANEVYILQVDRVVAPIDDEPSRRQRELHCIAADTDKLQEALEVAEKLRAEYESCQDACANMACTVIHAELMTVESPQFEKYFEQDFLVDFFVYYAGNTSNRESSRRSFMRMSRPGNPHVLEVPRALPRTVSRAFEVPRDSNRFENCESDFLLDDGKSSYAWRKTEASREEYSMKLLARTIESSRGNSNVPEFTPMDDASFQNKLSHVWSQRRRRSTAPENIDWGLQDPLECEANLYKVTPDIPSEGEGNCEGRERSSYQYSRENLSSSEGQPMDNCLYLVLEPNGHFFLFSEESEYLRLDSKDALDIILTFKRQELEQENNRASSFTFLPSKEYVSKELQDFFNPPDTEERAR